MEVAFLSRLAHLGQMLKQDFKKYWQLYLLVLPLISFYIIWAYGPMYGIQIAFKNFTPKKGISGSDWVGMKNFLSFFNSAYAFRVIRNTLLINVYNLAFGFPLPIIFALMLNEIRRSNFKRTVQTITYMPYFISLVIICGLIRDFGASDGVFGHISSLFGMNPVNILGDEKYFRTVYVTSEIWQFLGWNSILFMSALTSINPELFEAATIDGAGRFKQIWHISLPGILPTIAILLVLRIGGMMSVGFEKVILLYNPVIYETADVISSFVFRKGIIDADFGYATAVGLFNSVVNFTLVIVANKASAVLTETSLW
jgi:putative aldouronate transport system permease protein